MIVLQFLRLFWRDIGHRLILLFLLALAAALAEGFGFSMALPLLQLGGASSDNLIARGITLFFQGLGLEQDLAHVLLFLIFFMALRAVLMVWQTHYSARILADYLARLRLDLVSGLLRAHYRYFLSRDSGFLTNAVTRELDGVMFGLNMFITLGVATASAVVYLTLPLLYDPTASLFLAVVAVPIWLVMRRVNHLTRQYGLKNSATAAALQLTLIETMRHFKYFKATGTGQRMLDKLRVEVDRLSDIYARMNFLGGIASYAFEPLAVAALAALVWFMVQWRGQAIADIIFLLFLFRNAAVAILGVQPAWRKFLSTYGNLEVYRRVQQELAAQQPATTTHQKQSPDWSGDIELRQVSFSYRSATTAEAPFALRAINLRIRAGQVTAIVGPSGCGKSTLIDLITGLLSPDQGTIALSGCCYDDLDLNQLQQQIGFIPQQPAVFSDSLRNNITFWSDNIDPQRYRAIVDQVGLAHLEAQHLAVSEQGGEQSAGESGSLLSGGERQRVSIARELLRDTRLLILDEATSALDSQSEQRVTSTIAQERGQRTIVVIAHRLATIRHSDWIYVVDHGQIVGEGTFDELYQAGGLFHKLVELQRL
ncbi:MAG: ABC transporter ATP-binding protein [Magnetococcales bacterium]|nr:ABC transporter ATP-binding protein [Magnetococcales bacterium]